MAAITKVEIAAAYELGSKRLSGEITEAEAVSRLVDIYGMNRGSANDYVDALRHIRTGEVYRRTINAEAVAYYLSRIELDIGFEALELAIQSVRSHIEYYEGVSGSKSHKLRAVISELHDQKTSVNAQFQHLVGESSKLSGSARRKLLPKAGHKPSTSVVKTIVYNRSEHVVAERLAMAKGKCEHCRQPAPFIKKSNGQPYLEVHHEKRLADGGEDTVENARALCPNCHRKAHFG